MVFSNEIIKLFDRVFMVSVMVSEFRGAVFGQSRDVLVTKVVTDPWCEGHVESAYGVYVKIGEAVLFLLSARLVCFVEERGDHLEAFSCVAVVHVQER